MTRLENDAYFTDPRVAARLVRALHEHGYCPKYGEALEPSVGAGAFVRALSDVTDLNWTMLDVADRTQELGNLGADFFQMPFEDLEACETFQLIIGNPPYKHAEAHTRKALSHLAPGGKLAFLLRLAFLESAERFPFWEQFPARHVFVLSERPSFTGGGTDSSAYGFFVWIVDYKGPTELSVISWKDRA